MRPLHVPALPAALTLTIALCALVLLCACSNRSVIAARATVETFYTAVQADNLPVVQDNLAADASPQFQQRIMQAAAAAQAGGPAQQAVRITQVDTPSINGNAARVRVVFADGKSDVVYLDREGPRWKVVNSNSVSQ